MPPTMNAMTMPAKDDDNDETDGDDDGNGDERDVCSTQHMHGDVLGCPRDVGRMGVGGWCG